MNTFDQDNPRYAEAVVALMSSGGNVSAAAKESNLSDSTLRRYLRDPVFRLALRQAQGEALNLAVARLSGGAMLAVNTLLAVCEDEEASQAVKVQAASQILTHAVRMVETIEILERLEQLESRFGGDKQ